MRSGAKAIALIHRFEGIDSPRSWPGKASGVTIPYGYDLGYEQNFESDWKDLDEETKRRLRPALGVKGERAHTLCRTAMQGVRIPLDIAARVFNEVVMPREESVVMKVFPGSETLPGDAFGALVSLIFNRGSLIDKSDRRREMLALYNYFRSSPGPYDCGKVADLVESQARLWQDVKSSDGDLHDRRIAEAVLIRSCA
jgi:GH24 family phage-related lysozyme (muramidase)